LYLSVFLDSSCITSR